MSRILVISIVFVALLVGCKSYSKQEIDNGIYAAQSAGKLAQDLGCEARINLRVVPQGRAGFYGPGVELDSRTELDANLTIVSSRTGPVEVAIPDEEPEEPADEEGPVSDTNDVGDTESPDNPD